MSFFSFVSKIVSKLTNSTEFIKLGAYSRCRSANPCILRSRYMHSIIPLWQLAVCWMMVGTGYAGVFTLAHDAARGSLLPFAPAIQDILGTVLMAPSLYSFESWRLRFVSHTVFPNMLGEDDGAWQPLTKAALAAMGPFRRKVARIFATTPLKLFGSIGHWASSWGGLDLKPYQPGTRLSILMSWAVPLWFAGIAGPAMLLAGGVPGVRTPPL